MDEVGLLFIQKSRPGPFEAQASMKMQDNSVNRLAIHRVDHGGSSAGIESKKKHRRYGCRTATVLAVPCFR